MPTTGKFIAMDSVSRARVTAAVPHIVYGALPDPVTEDYVRTIAVGVGLNRFGFRGPPTEDNPVPPSLLPTIQTFAVQLEADDVQAVGVAVENDDLARAQAWADWLESGVTVDLVLSAALCTGIVCIDTSSGGAALAAQPARLPAIGPFVAPPS